MRHRFFPLSLSVGAALLACLSSPRARGDGAIPEKDIAILADVSASVRKDAARYDEARRMITDLVLGRSINWALSEWAVEEGSDRQIQDLFGAALGTQGGTAQLSRLTSPAHALQLLPVGRLRTIITSNVTRTVGPVEDFGETLRTIYPRAGDLRDGSTCFWYAMACAAQTLRTNSPDGYYLFVVSDEVDDPDYLRDGPKGHSVADYEYYHKNMEAQFPVAEIFRTINLHFERRGMGRDAYVPRPDFPRNLIARFYQRRFPRDDESKVRLSWYAMGVKPTRVSTPIVAPAPAPEPPKFRRAIQLLGGLESVETKVFHYPDPLIVWQVPDGEANGLGNARFTVQNAQGRPIPTGQSPGSVLAASPRLRGPKTAQLRLASGSYAIQVVAGGEREPVKSKLVKVRVEPPNHWVIPLLSITSALASAGLFIWMWAGLRSPRSSGKSTFSDLIP